MSSLLKISVSVLFIFFSLTASGGDPYRPSSGAGEAGMGYVCIMKNGFWSSFHNPANLAYNNSYSLGFNYESRFSIRELGTRSAAFTIHAGKASLGALYTHFGYTDFRRDMTGLACGMKISDIISAGVQVDYFSTRTSGDYDNNQSVTCEAGVLLAITENIRVGLHVFNPVPNSIRKTYLPTTLRLGAGTNLNKLLFAGVETEMSKGGKLIFRTGFEYEVPKKFLLRGGYSTDNNSFSFGLGLLVKVVQIDLAFVTHESLGVTSSVSLIFKIHKEIH